MMLSAEGLAALLDDAFPRRTPAELDEYRRRSGAARGIPATKPAPRQRRIGAADGVERRAKKYGLTKGRLEELLAEGKCDACGTVDPGMNGWHVDHDHKCCDGGSSCGKCVRGILCGYCNVALGMLRDSPERLRALLEYLARSPA